MCVLIEFLNFTLLCLKKVCNESRKNRRDKTRRALHASLLAGRECEKPSLKEKRRTVLLLEILNFYLLKELTMLFDLL